MTKSTNLTERIRTERDIDYHGYRADDLGDDIKYRLDREFA